MEVVKIHKERLIHLCERYHVDQLYLFGSALGLNLTSESDIDFLVKFKPIDLAGYFENYMNLKQELELLFDRRIDLLEEKTLKNPVLIKSINQSKELIYG